MTQEWMDFLCRQSLSGDHENFGDPAGELSAAAAGTIVAPLLDRRTIQVGGDDRVAFLHNLLTNDIEHLAVDQLRFAGLCTAKGRLLASLHVWHDADYLSLMVAADLRETLLKKLSMYVLRSKVRLSDTGDAVALLGLGGDTAAATIERLAGTVPEPRHTAAIAGGRVLRLDTDRFVLAVDPAGAIALWPSLTATARPAGPAAWRWLEIRAGQPTVVAATQEAFVPQMANFEIAEVAGLSFTKGCYPGQEVVARAQYIGKVKRRMYRARAATPLTPGVELFSPETGSQHCGTLAVAAPTPAGGWECLAVIQNSAVATGEVHIGAPDGPRLEFLPLPYAVD